MENEEPAVYLFCFARSDAVDELRETAVDGHSPLSIVRHSADLCAVVSQAAREDFCGAVAELRMQQLAWLAPRALRHETVVEEVLTYSPVLPVPYGTLFSSLDALTRFVDHNRQAISLFLQHTAQQREWSVKGWFDRKQAQRTVLSARLDGEQAQLSQMSPGKRHFAEQRISRDIEKDLTAWLDQTCRAIAAGLGTWASDFRECALISRPSAESGLEEALNWAFLLPDAAVAPFQELIERENLDHRPHGLRLELSGPWPPYRFVPSLATPGIP